MMGSFKASLINMTAKVTRCNVFIYNLHSSLLAFSQYGRGHSHGLIRTTIVKKSRKAPVRVYSCSKVSCSKFFQINYFLENVFLSFLLNAFAKKVTWNFFSVKSDWITVNRKSQSDSQVAKRFLLNLTFPQLCFKKYWHLFGCCFEMK